MCETCGNRKCHVQLCGDSITGIKSERLKQILKECSIVKPLHVIKTEQKNFALIHFESELDASTFYYVYCIQKKLICKRLEGIGVNPSLLDNKPINYSNFQVQPRISSSSKLMCHCSIALGTNISNDSTASFSNNSTSNANPSNRNVDTPVISKTDANNHESSTASTNTNPSNRNVDTPVISTIDANNHESSTTSTNTNPNTTASTIISTSDDYNEDIEKAKSKIKKQIERKLQEVEVLQKKLRRLEDF
ncbi:hypothetical protein BD408DRAFT_366946 [Parasitella parasitica]|nr:hypothetical protein BD408DRAFT_366946 [Parasitella parasitica]